MDGELTPALQGAFVSTLLGASPPGPLSRLHFSERSSLDLEGALHFAFELDSAASWSMGLDLVTRCGVVFLETSESDEDRALVDGWVQSLKMYGVVADLVERLCRTVLKPLPSLL